MDENKDQSSLQSDTDSKQSDELISMKQAIQLLKTTRSTFYRWVRGGKIKGMKVGRQWRFYLEDIERFLKGREPRIDLPADIKPFIKELQQHTKKFGENDILLPETDEIRHALDLMILLAVKMRASDIHLAPNIKEDGTTAATLRYRIDGVLHTIAEIDIRLLPILIEQWKIAASCNVYEKEKPQDGRILASAISKGIDLRVSFLPTILGESLTVRIFDQSSAKIKLADIDFASYDREKIIRWVESSHGMIIVSGPTGSGKTAVFYSLLSHISNPERKVMTVENPVEFSIPWVVQVPVRSDVGLTFPVALRSIFRSDPDVIGIGELSDYETIEIAHHCALTGHLVIATMHADESVRVLKRMVDMGCDPFIIGESTGLITAQRLVRKICSYCNIEKTPSDKMLKKAEDIAQANGLDWNSLTKNFREPVGCDKCNNTGYRGRNVIAETLEVTPEIVSALGCDVTIEELRNIAIKQGMVSIAADGLRRSAMGNIPLAEVLRVLALK